ncbi:MAG: F0F1 ATP synthase subunit epsilon [Deltaproteobacteria bacterium]
MHLKILLPTEVLLDRDVSKVLAEGTNGSFCLLPRHQDFVTALVPGLLSFVADAREEFVAVDEGVLIKIGNEVLASTRRAVRGPDLGMLRQTVEREFLELDERQRLTRSAMARLGADFARRLYELGKEHE